MRRRAGGTAGFGLALSCLSLLLGCRAGCGALGDPVADLQRHLPVRSGINVLVISFDALRADALGVLGSARDLTPNLDAFARQSIVFERAYTVAPVTPTSFAAAFTGMLPTRVFHAWKLVYEDTLALRFQQAGYRTAAFINNLQLARERGFDRGFELYDLHRSGPDEKLAESALAWLADNADQRFFAWVHFLTPHAPYEYREVAAHLYEAGYQGRFEKTTTGTFETDDPREVARIRSLYDGEVYWADLLFGRFLEGVRELGLLETTLVIVTSDHGEEFYEHGRFQHDRLTEEHVRIPLLVYHPDVGSGHRSDLLVSNLDLLPTLLSVAGLPGAGPLDGRDWTALTEAPQRIVGVSMTGGKERWLSLRKGRWKLIETCLPERGRVLYDLASDPGEQVDVLARQRRRAEQLHAELDSILAGDPCQVMTAAVSGADATVGLTADDIEALRALGYLGN